MKFSDINLAMKLVQYLNKPTHMGALKLMGQIHVHIDSGDRFLTALGFIKHSHRIGDGFHSHLLYIDTSVIFLILNIFHN